MAFWSTVSLSMRKSVGASTGSVVTEIGIPDVPLVSLLDLYAAKPAVS
jgi:hypothetical protein